MNLKQISLCSILALSAVTAYAEQEANSDAYEPDFVGYHIESNLAERSARELRCLNLAYGLDRDAGSRRQRLSDYTLANCYSATGKRFEIAEVEFNNLTPEEQVAFSEALAEHSRTVQRYILLQRPPVDFERLLQESAQRWRQMLSQNGESMTILDLGESNSYGRRNSVPQTYQPFYRGGLKKFRN